MATASLAAWSASWGAAVVAAVTLVAAGALVGWAPRVSGRTAQRVAAGLVAALAVPWATRSVAVAAVHLLLGVVVLALSLRGAESARAQGAAGNVRSSRAPRASMGAGGPPSAEAGSLSPRARRSAKTAPKAPPLQPPATQSAPSTSARTSVLLVDDNPANRFYGTLLLKRLGHDVEVASTGEQAVEAAVRQRFDVVLMDVRMPGMGGVAAAKALRERIPPHRRPYIAALTADDRAEERERLLREGMDAFLPKPLQADQLTAMLGEAGGVPNAVAVF